jgi:PKD repeat protein
VLHNALDDLLHFTVTEVSPVAAFVASPRSGLLPLTVHFADTSSGIITRWLWSFGDGLTSTLPSLSHTYNLSGTFGVTLTVNGPGGSSVRFEPEYIHITAEYKVYLPVVIKGPHD